MVVDFITYPNASGGDSMNKISRRLFMVLVFGIALTTAPAGELKELSPVDAKLVALNKYRPVMNVVKKYYPQASHLLFENRLHFEDSTMLYVERMIAKVPAGGKPPFEEVRGPTEDGGVWCDIVLLEGSSAAYARSEGAVERGHFVEHMI